MIRRKQFLEKTGKQIRRILVLLFLLGGFLAPVLSPVEAEATTIRGIDVSKWQGRIDWVKVKNAGIKFVMLGCGHYYATGPVQDPYFEYNIKNATAQGIKVGIYLYSYAMNETMARREAEYVLDQIEGYKISYPVAFDIEDPSQQKKLTNAERTNITKAFLDVIESEGYYPAIYASNSWFVQSMNLSQLTQYDKWVAAWSTTPTISYTMWQYSSTGRISGINADVDLDHSYVNYSKIIKPRTLRRSKEGKEGWRKEKGKYRYYQENGKVLKKKFVEIDGHKFYVNNKGYRVTGWQTIKKKTYHFDEITGVLSTGWVPIDGRYYLFSEETGELQTGFVTRPNGKMYYLGTEGYRSYGWIQVDNKTYYTDQDGVVQMGREKINGDTYYFDKTTGEMKTGWVKIKKKYYYFNPKNGKMKYSCWLRLNSKRYYLAKNGERIAGGWLKVKGKMYYLNEKGVVQKNKTIGKYILGKDGACLNWDK